MGAFEDLIGHLTFERGYLDFGAQGGFGEGYRDFAVDVVAVALEDCVRSYGYGDYEVAVRAAVSAGTASVKTAESSFDGLRGQRTGRGS